MKGREILGVQTTSYVIAKGTPTKFLGTSSQAFSNNRVCIGHGKTRKSWDLRISFSRPGGSWHLNVTHGNSWK